MEGWIKLHRKFLDWEWYSDSGTVHLFMHLLFKANHETKKWQGIVINRGQFVTSYDKLSAELPLSVQQIRTRLSKLKSTGEITIKNNNKYSIITVTCYSDYQTINKPDNKQATSQQQTDNKQITTTKELKELKELKEVSKIELFPLWLDLVLWQDFVNHRKAIKAPLTKKAEDLAMGALLKLIEKGYSQQELIENTILNGWKTFYEPKTNQQHKGNGYGTQQAKQSLSEQARNVLQRI